MHIWGKSIQMLQRTPSGCNIHNHGLLSTEYQQLLFQNENMDPILISSLSLYAIWSLAIIKSANISGGHCITEENSNRIKMQGTKQRV